MPSFVVEAPGRARLAHRPAAEPGPGEVRVRVEAVGICGSDLEMVDGHRDPAFQRLPVVLGHEWSGRVDRLGAGVSGALLGARVAVEGHNYCGGCAACRIGATQRCTSYDEFGFTRDGGYGPSVCARADLCHPMAHASAEVAATTEPAACALHVVERVDVRPPDTVLVLGGGPIGLLATAHAVARGAARVIVADVREAVTPFARAVGASEVVTAAADHLPEALAAVLPAGADVVVEAAGRVETQRLALTLVARGGRVGLVGIAGHGRTTAMSLDALVFRDARVEATFAYPSAVFARAARLLDAGLVDPRPILTHRLPLSRVDEAFALLRSGADGVVKVMLDPQV